MSSVFNIIKYISKKHPSINEKRKTSTNTITKVVNSKINEKLLEKYFDEILKRYRYKPEKFQKALEKLYPSPKHSTGVGIRAFLREEAHEKKRLQGKQNKND